MRRTLASAAAVLSTAAITAVSLLTGPLASDAAAGPQARPAFEAPWKCGVTLQYYHHSQEVHNAIDFNANGNYMALATAGGTVVHAGWNGGYGNEVVIDHGGGWRTRIGHLQSLATRNGARVTRGQQVGRVGTTGHSFGEHIHYEQIYNGANQGIVLHGVALRYTAAHTNITSHNCGGDSTGGYSTWGNGVKIYQDSTSKSKVVNTLAKPTSVEIECQRRGEKLTISDGGKTYTNDAWAYLPKYKGFVTNIYVDVPEPWIPGIRDCATFPTWGTDLRVRQDATTKSAQVGTIPQPTNVRIQCQRRGEKVTISDGGKTYTSDAWSFLPDKKGYVSNIFVDHPAAWLPLVPTCA